MFNYELQTHDYEPVDLILFKECEAAGNGTLLFAASFQNRIKAVF